MLAMGLYLTQNKHDKIWIVFASEFPVRSSKFQREPKAPAKRPTLSLLEWRCFMRRLFRIHAIAGCLALLAAGACSDTPTNPSRPQGLPVVETFTGTLQPSGTAFYSFSMSQSGNIALTLISMTGPSVPDDALFPVGISTPAGNGCPAPTDAAIRPGASPQHTVAKSSGVYCVQISDNARLGAPATFVLNITHPK